ncbi:helix-hairpin-helix domain-containing protein [Pseudokineococcus lusitanus]|uniref:Competence protein ComEA n=1 Tax=Pseudokineococcus lusitanus TaxID=763993 RepID=A0A3N1HTI5_9ACTN|nr:helix-hairpin-helix domain-containing protein [Pseudokineococcus lusitanus]ROP45831.1 competence protein ComEA [Pseudokineococcus lusitanus]
MRSERGGATDADLVRRRLDAVLGGADGPGAGPCADADDLDGEARPPHRRGRGGHLADADLAEGLGLWPQLWGALADRVPAPLRGGRWRASAPAAVAALVLAAAVVLVLAVRATAGAPGLPVPARAPVAVAGSTTAAAGAPGAASPTTGPPPATGAPPAPVGAPGMTGVTGSLAPTTVPPATGTASGGAAAAVVVVHVVGQVGAPGVVRLPEGSRVAEAVAAAGGASEGADLARVNLARLLVDGEQVVVPAPGEELPAPEAAPAGGAGASAGGATGTAPGAAPGAGGAGGGPGGAAPVDLNTATLADLDALPGIGPVLAQRVLDVRAEMGAFTSVEELGEVSGIGEARLADLRDRVVVR